MTSVQTAVEALQGWAAREINTWNDDASQRFVRYIELILHYQKQTNLTGFSTPDALVNEMMVDSLQILKVLQPVGPLIDVGSGAGFPGIPLKILYPEVEMHLVEPRTKRYAFLQLVCRELGLSKIRVHNQRIEQLDLPCVKTAISKAFTRPGDWVELCRPWVDRDQAVIACYLSQADDEAFVAPLIASDPAWHVHRHVAAGHRVYLTLSRDV